jgi:hypothetical protein
MKQKHRAMELTPDDFEQISVSDIAGNIPELELLTNFEFQSPEESDSPIVTRATNTVPVASCVTICPTKILDEDFLTEQQRLLLHGRAFIVDRVELIGTSSNNPVTYYLASDQVQGLVIPARSLSIENHGPSIVYYRWTDFGEKWTSWITLEDGIHDEYEVAEKLRFGEVQVYSNDVAGTLISIRATR